MAYALRMGISETERIKIIAVSLFVVGRGRGGLVGMDFFYLLGR